MSAIAWTLVALAGALHVFIWVMESLLIDGKQARATFGVRTEDLEAIRPWAYNQGFYNLFLAVGCFVAVGLAATHHDTSARTLGYFACGSIVAAAVVLISYDRTKAAAAAKQGTFAALAIVALLATS